MEVVDESEANISSLIVADERPVESLVSGWSEAINLQMNQQMND